MLLIIKFWLIYMLSFSFFSKTSSAYTKPTLQQQDKTLIESIKRGKTIYTKYCTRCHKSNGQGSKNYPPLANSDWLTTKTTESIQAIKFGLKGAITVNGKNYKRTMPKQKLEDNEIANVMNYIMNNWENKQKQMITPEDVNLIKK